MSVHRIDAGAALAQLGAFSAVIDARSESEWAHDHLPGALNWPSLHDDERARVGTMYKQVSPFEAQKLGAALVARNIAAHIEREVMDKPKNWQPLLYCWRGGQRSGALGLILGQIGFRVQVIEGGYKAFRRAMLADLPARVQRLQYRVVCGPTGSGKTRLLHALHAAGAQVLDLEALASHRASVLGLIPGHPQPSQKRFEMLVWDTLGQRLNINQLFDQQGNLPAGQIPLLQLDMWEHAFYLQYKNVKADYVTAFWNIVNWSDVAERFAKASAK